MSKKEFLRITKSVTVYQEDYIDISETPNEERKLVEFNIYKANGNKKKKKNGDSSQIYT